MSKNVLKAEWVRPGGSAVRLSLNRHRGKVQADLRLYWQDKSGEWKPTRKGVAIQLAELPALVLALQSVIADTESSSHA